MTYTELRGRSSEAFRRYSGVKPETFEVMLGVLREVGQDKKRSGRPSKLMANCF